MTRLKLPKLKTVVAYTALFLVAAFFVLIKLDLLLAFINTDYKTQAQKRVALREVMTIWSISTSHRRIQHGSFLDFEAGMAIGEAVTKLIDNPVIERFTVYEKLITVDSPDQLPLLAASRGIIVNSKSFFVYFEGDEVLTDRTIVNSGNEEVRALFENAQTRQEVFSILSEYMRVNPETTVRSIQLSDQGSIELVNLSNEDIEYITEGDSWGFNLEIFEEEFMNVLIGFENGKISEINTYYQPFFK